VDHFLDLDSIAFFLWGMSQGVGSETFEFLTENLHKVVSKLLLAVGFITFALAQRAAAPVATTTFDGRKANLGHLPPGTSSMPLFPGGIGHAVDDLLLALVAAAVGFGAGLLLSSAASKLRAKKPVPAQVDDPK
jgi:hypothetical protein